MPSHWPVLLLAVAVFVPSFALAATTKTASISLSAEVLPACSAGSTATDSLGQFGTLDLGTHSTLGSPLDVTGQQGNGALRVNCASNTPYRVLISAGDSGNVNARRMTGPGAQIRYNLYTSASYQTVWDNSQGASFNGTGADQWLPVYARVPAQPAPVAGIYRDTVTVTVQW